MNEFEQDKRESRGQVMRRILQHNIPGDISYGTRRYLEDSWIQVPKAQRQHAVCLECGLPTLRLVYQQSEVYTMICMSCGHAYRYHATDWYEAEDKYASVQQKGYDKAKHAVGLDYHEAPSLRNHYDNGDKGCPFVGFDPAWYKQYSNGMWGITPEGYRFLGYDILGEDGLSKPITW
nr:MAG TPA: RNA polymerase II-like protein [Caudoviricetes sp.]